MPAARFTPQQEQQRILDVAARSIAATSLLDFTMSSISREAGLSMGSVYKHLKTKEDILIALATNMFINLAQVFKRILSLPLSLPELLLGINLMTPDKYRLYCFDAHLEMLIDNEAVLKRASREWVEKMVHADKAIENCFNDRVSQAIDCGELDLAGQNRDRVEEEILMAIWTMNVGFCQVAYQRHSRGLVGYGKDLPFPLAVDNPFIIAVQRLLNSYQWQKPLTEAGIKNLCRVLEQEGLR